MEKNPFSIFNKGEVYIILSFVLFKDSECRNTFKNPFSTLNKVEVYIILSLYHLKTVNEEVNIENEKKNPPHLYLNNITYMVFPLKKDVTSIHS